jgi:hypothetical protein
MLIASCDEWMRLRGFGWRSCKNANTWGENSGGDEAAWNDKATRSRQRFGVNESTITRWKANGPMSVNSAVLLCKELDISLDWFLNGTGSMNSHKLNVQMPSITQDKLLAHFQRFEATLSDHSKSLLIAFMDSLLPKQPEE